MTTVELFPLGMLFATPCALQALVDSETDPQTILARHSTCDWGDLTPENLKANEDALRDGAQLFSMYKVAPAVKVYVITEADRSKTTMMLSEEY